MSEKSSILPLEEFEKLDVSKQAELMKRLRQDYKDVDIRRKWGYNQNQLYRLIQKLGLPKLRREPWLPTIVPERKVRDNIPRHFEPATSPSVRNRRTIAIALDGVYSADSLAKQLQGLSSLLLGVDGKFKITLKVEESE